MIKSERGSATLITISSCILMTFVLVGIFMGLQNKTINQKSQVETLQNNYKAKDEDLEKEYNKVLNYITKVTITYNQNGGTGTMKNTEIRKNQTTTLLPNAFTPPIGYKFKK